METQWGRRRAAVVFLVLGFIAQLVISAVTGLPGLWPGAVSVAILALIVWSGWPYLQRWRSLLWPSTEFYEDAREKERERGSLYREIADSDRLWLAFESGVFFEREDLEAAHGNIERVLLLAPEGDYLPIYHTRQDANIGLQEIRDKIRRATRYVQDADMPVRWYDGHLMNCVVGEPHSDRTWVRVHYQIPHHYRSINWPDFVVRKVERPVLVERLQESFDRMWEVAVRPPTPDR